ncbi:hypothetical protein Cgig2_012511 [Carnegiea gigantea]|uniref:C2 NT-type domain-containing protein n=1 Tax=Carnegiea gigantea TaxID=171969 RepID=A0A9Q1K5X4_9CARY|nr:hypothetical protein Cgig2_012511 [Carnegiea gigantea]
MFKVGRWRNEKIKVVFRLQFQATQVPCSKSRLMISLVPVDVGQPTVRLGKAAVQDGICTWENPVYESVKFTRETKTGKIHDKIYHFIISTGSSKAGFLGEVSVNLADYVGATTPFAISLPIKSSNCGAILHVTIQNTQGADDQRGLQRGIEENELLIARPQERSLQSQLSNSQSDRDDECRSCTVSPDDWRQNLVNSNNFNSASEQNDDRIHQDTCRDRSQPSNNPESRALNEVEKQHQSIDSLLDWSSDEDSANFEENTEENFPREQEQEPPTNLVEQLKRENFSLKRQAEVTDIELQSLRRQVVKETKRGQELSRQVAKLRGERDAFKAESEKLKSQQNGVINFELPQEMGSQSKESWDRLNEVKQDLKHAKDLNRALRLRLSKTQDSNSELILVVRDLEEKIDKKDKELATLYSKMKSNRNPEEFNDDNSEIVNENEVSAAATPKTDDVNLLQQQINDLQDELEHHVKEKREVEQELEQLSQDYEISKKENNNLSSKFNQKQLELIKKEKECTSYLRKMEELESHIARLENVIKKQAEEFSESSEIIDDLENQVKSLKQELERQAEEFEEDLKAMNNAKVDEEKRALQAEEKLRKAKLDNAIVAQRLQEEFRKLSEELTLQFKESEKSTMKAEADAQELRLHISILEEDLQKATTELELAQDQCKTEVQNISSLLTEKKKEFAQLSLAHKDEIEDLKVAKKKAEDKCEAFSNENQALRVEIERLTEENYYFGKQLEEMKTLLDEAKTALEESNKQKDDLGRRYASAKTEVQQSQEELKTLRSLKEKEDAMAGVQSELQKLQAQHNQLKTQLSELKLENENLRKQLTRQKESLQKKEHEIANLEKLKNNSSKEVSILKEKIKQLKGERAAVAEEIQHRTSVDLQAVRPAGISPDNGSKVEEKKYMGKKIQHSEFSGKQPQNGPYRLSGESKREICTEKKAPDSQTNDLLREVEMLREKHKSMEDELKEMQEKYSEVSLKFAEVEGERQQLVMTIRNLRNGQKK